MYIKVRAYPNSKEESFTKTGNDSFEARVREKAERNMANRRIVELVREHFHIGEGKGSVRIINGHQSPSKLLSIDIAEESI